MSDGRETMAAPRAATVGQLKDAGYRPRSVREELRENLIDALSSGARLFPGISGYDDTVIPQVQNALLAGHDIVLLGERGQAKSRLLRALLGLLDEWVPVLEGTEIPEDPFAPVTARGRALAGKGGDAAAIRWMHRDERYGEKLATPDITIADLIGEVDPIKVAEGLYLSDEMTIHYGLIPRSNRGIFAINELPDLSERIQVGLLNVMEERDVQIRGHKVRLDLDVLIVATANPEDYTNRGRIITPLKDRYGAHIRTHYPIQLDREIEIMEQEAVVTGTATRQVVAPSWMKEIIAEVTRLARHSPDVNQRSGVSVRASISNIESLCSNALRRAVRLGEDTAVPRISDLPAIRPSLDGKIEFETIEDDGEDKIVTRLIDAAVATVFNRHCDADTLGDIATAFTTGATVEVGADRASGDYEGLIATIAGLADAVEQVLEIDQDRPEGGAPQHRAAAAEFILEGLHLNRRLNKEVAASGTRYGGGASDR